MFRKYHIVLFILVRYTLHWRLFRVIVSNMDSEFEIDFMVIF